jgi:hypothetical protein
MSCDLRYLVLLVLLIGHSGGSELGSTGFSGSLRSGLAAAGSPREFFELLGDSEEFKESVWQKRPLLIKGALKCKGDDELFNLKDLYDACPTFAAGHVTESGIDGSKEGLVGGGGGGGGSTWVFRPLNPNQLRGEPLQTSHVQDAVRARPPSTISFNTAGSLFPKVGELCLSAIGGLRYPVNVS